MRTVVLAILMAAGIFSSAQAGMMHFGRGHHGGRGFGGGFGIYDTAAAQSRFEDRFADLMTEYDEGLAEIDDYYNSDEYGEVVDNVELLSDRYDFFLNGVERTIDRFDNLLTSLGDELTYFDELLAEYQANEELSEERLERITSWITSIQDFLGLKIDYITEKQSVLEENYVTYSAFGDEISTYLDTIVSAGGSTTDVDETTTVTTAAAIAATAPLYATAADDVAAVCEEAFATATAVPEPTAAALLVSSSWVLMSRGLRRAI